MTKYKELEKIAKKQFGISLDSAYTSAGDGKGTFRLQGILNAMERAYEAGRRDGREAAEARAAK